MRHLHNLKDAKLEGESLVTIGVFDGVHGGHQALVQSLVSSARAAERKSVVITFFPHPDTVLEDVEQRYYLTTADKRAELLLRLGVDYVITHPFDEQVRHLPAAEFVDQLVEYLRLKELWVGTDFALGFQREGDIEFLREQGRLHGFTVRAIELVSKLDSGQLISSSKVREHIRRGEMDEAKAMLGRAYELEGLVVLGEQRGRTIGVPTANLEVWSEQVIPANGVYAAWICLGDEIFMSATNIGIRPTFAGDELTIEAHLLDFERDIYGEHLELRFEKRLRAEQKFQSLDELLAQIKTDINNARTCLEQNTPT